MLLETFPEDYALVCHPEPVFCVPQERIVSAACGEDTQFVATLDVDLQGSKGGLRGLSSRGRRG